MSLSGSRSSASVSAERRPADVCDSEEANCQSVISSVGACTGCRCLRRYELMYVFVRIRYSQALRFVPSSNWWNAEYALRNVSCTRSSASAGLRVIRRPAAYNWSTNGKASRSKRARLSSVRSFWATLDLPLGCTAEDTGSAPGSVSKTAGVLTLTDGVTDEGSTAGHSGD